MTINAGRLLRVPNAECWIDRISVVAVRKLEDAYQYLDTETNRRNKQAVVAGVRPDAKRIEGVDYIRLVAFELRMIDGKAITVQCLDRNEMSKFLEEIGVEWSA